MTDEELIARVREAVPFDVLADFDTLARRLEELKGGLERIADGRRNRTDGSLGPWAGWLDIEECRAIARSLLHPEPQEERQ